MVLNIILFYVLCVWCLFFFCKQKTAYEMRISDWSSDVCSSDLPRFASIMKLVVSLHPLRHGIHIEAAGQLRHRLNDGAVFIALVDAGHEGLIHLDRKSVV